jgi:squalene cyclase
MMDRLTEALIQERDVAVEARTMQYGPQYASALEGYGDLTRELLNLQSSTKALKKELADIVDWVSAQDLQELHKALVLMEGKAHQAAYDALRMCASVRVFQETVRARSGGDLLDILMDDPGDDHDG